MGAAIKRLKFYYKRSRLEEENPYFESDHQVTQNPFTSEQISLTKAPEIFSHTHKKPPLHLDSEYAKVSKKNKSFNNLKYQTSPQNPRSRVIGATHLGEDNKLLYSNIDDTIKFTPSNKEMPSSFSRQERTDIDHEDQQLRKHHQATDKGK